MKSGKFFVFALSPERPEFLGPTLIYALTLPRDHAPVISCVELNLSSARDPEQRKQAAQRALDRLSASLPDNFYFIGAFTDEALFQETAIRERSPIVIDRASQPEDFHAAIDHARTHFNQRLAMLQTEWPQLPWNSEDSATHDQALRKFGSLAQEFYDLTHPTVAPLWHEITRRKRLLLHVCCGPDAAGVIEQLKRDYDVVGFWYDPNIQPRAEHDKRVDAFVKVAQLEGIPHIVGEYDVENFLGAIKGLEHTPEQGAKCSRCYDMRLERAAIEAKKLGCDLYTTTLAISPHKVQEKLKSFGALNEKKHGIPYLARNFMKDDGFKDSIDYTRTNSIYRQDYCGCWFSLYEGGPQARALGEKLGLTPEALLQNANTSDRNNDQLEADYAGLKASGETLIGADAYRADDHTRSTG